MSIKLFRFNIREFNLQIGMKEVFLLGAGFSKAVLNAMPVTAELAQEVLSVLRAETLPFEVDQMLRDDFEKALSYLATDKPWVSEAENLRHQALYINITHVVRMILNDRSRDPVAWGTNHAPLWLEALITHWHRTKAVVITLNYDTIIERVAGTTAWSLREERIPTHLLYSIPLTPASTRSESGEEDFGSLAASGSSFTLHKLHGSVNWFYSGRREFFGEQLFYVPCKGGLDGCFDALDGRDPEGPHWAQTRDKVALIIPPVLDKGVFFQHESLRSMWWQAGKALREASRIICMGYSMPESDLTMAQFLRTSRAEDPKPFLILNRTPLASRFEKVIGKACFEYQDGPQPGEDTIKHFVLHNCVPKDRQAEVAANTEWRDKQTRQ